MEDELKQQDATGDKPVLSSRGKTFSLCMNVDGFLRNNRYPRDFKGVFQQNDGTPLEPEEALAFLTTEKAKGRKVIPCSGECGNPCKHSNNGCTGFDYSGGGCPGRYSTATGTPDEAESPTT